MEDGMPMRVPMIVHTSVRGLMTIIINSFGADFWFGLDSLHKEGVFQWADGTLLRNSRFTMWLSDKPEYLQGYQFCVAQEGEGWNNLPCSEERDFICEKSKECPAGKWNVPICDLLCDNCYNGGICNPLTGSCICTTGFSGKNCLKDCTNGKFGSACLQDCHCMDGMQCDLFTGRCAGSCENGWSGDGCQVPSICPKGYFGVNCTDHCNCPEITDCDKDSGFCTTSDGQCEIGFTTDSVDMPDSCSSYTGCFGLCSSTCHCRGGKEDCNLVNGSCSSGRCHPRWTGDNCQIDRFQSTRQKTNPGVMGTANFSCAVSFDSILHVGPDYVKAAIGDFSIDNWKLVNDPPLQISTTLQNFSFYIEDIPDGSPIYCFIGNPLDTSSEFGYVKLASASTFALPSLVTPPYVVELGYYWVVISWRLWNAFIDCGEGPITGYRVYVHTEYGNQTHISTILPDGSLDTGLARNRRELTCEDMGRLENNITGLEDGTNYEVRIAVIREGPKGEGDRGPVLSVKTQELSIGTPTPTDATGYPTNCQGVCIGCWILFGISIVGNVVLAGVIVLSCFNKRRTTSRPLPEAAPPKVLSDASPEYENPVFDASMTEQHNYQDLVKVNNEDNYEEITKGRHANYENTSAL